MLDVVPGSLKVSSFFKFFFLFAVPIRWFPLPYLVDLWSILFQPLACCWLPLVYFSFQLLYSSSLIFLYILSLCWSSEFIHSSLELMSIFTAINLIPLSGKFIWCLYLLIFVSFSCFSRVLSFPFIWDKTLCFFILINFLWCGLDSSHNGIVVLASSVCPLLDEGISFLIGGTGGGRN